MPINPKIFKEYDIRGEYPWELDEAAAEAIARAFVGFKKARKVAVARDFRAESQKIHAAFIRGLAAAGAKIFDLGVDSTPALFFAVGTGRFDAGAMVTASHNPEGYTGLKLCGKDGRLIGSENGLREIARQAEENPPLPEGGARGGGRRKIKKARNQESKKVSIISDYYRFVSSFVEMKKIQPMKLVLDASNGSGAKMIDHVFVRLPGQAVKMNFGRRDKYPDHDLNPILPKNHLSICRETRKQKARLGIIWDGDGDRIIFIDEKGVLVEPYHLNCLLAKIILAKWPKIKIIIDARMRLGLSEVIRRSGGQAVINRSGYANIVQTMQKEKILFGCENSGHYMFNFSLARPSRNYVFGDGIIPALLILEYLSVSGLGLSEALKPDREKYFISGEINIQVKSKKEKVKRLEDLENKIKRYYGTYKTEEIDGLSVHGKDWFFNIRPSHTEPLMRINVEARDKGTVVKIKKELLEIIK